MKTKIAVELVVDHDEGITDERLHEAVTSALPGTILIPEMRPGLGFEPHGGAVLDDVTVVGDST